MKRVHYIIALLIVAGLAHAQEDDAYTNAVNRMFQLPISGHELALSAQHMLLASPDDATRNSFESRCATNRDVSSIFLTLSGPEMRSLGFTLDDARSAVLMNRMLTGESPVGPRDVTIANVNRQSPRLVSGAIQLSAEGILKARLFFRVVKQDGVWTPERLDIWNPHTSETVPLLQWSGSRPTMVERMRHRSGDAGGEHPAGGDVR